MAVELVVSARSVSTKLWARGRLDMRPCSCCQSRRISWQLCFWAMLAAWNTLVSNSWGVRPVLNTRKVSRNIRSFWLCSSFKRFLASRP